jgi:hypothetical protein
MGASAWHGLIGTPGYLAGASGTVTLPANATLIAVVAHATAAGSFTLLGGPSVPVPAGTQIALDFKHALFVAQGASAQIVFTGTDSYFVHYVKQGNA